MSIGITHYEIRIILMDCTVAEFMRHIDLSKFETNTNGPYLLFRRSNGC